MNKQGFWHAVTAIVITISVVITGTTGVAAASEQNTSDDGVALTTEEVEVDRSDIKASSLTRREVRQIVQHVKNDCERIPAGQERRSCRRDIREYREAKDAALAECENLNARQACRRIARLTAQNEKSIFETISALSPGVVSGAEDVQVAVLDLLGEEEPGSAVIVTNAEPVESMHVSWAGDSQAGVEVEVELQPDIAVSGGVGYGPNVISILEPAVGLIVSTYGEFSVNMYLNEFPLADTAANSVRQLFGVTADLRASSEARSGILSAYMNIVNKPSGGYRSMATSDFTSYDGTTCNDVSASFSYVGVGVTLPIFEICAGKVTSTKIYRGTRLEFNASALAAAINHQITWRHWYPEVVEFGGRNQYYQNKGTWPKGRMQARVTFVKWSSAWLGDRRLTGWSDGEEMSRQITQWS